MSPVPKQLLHQPCRELKENKRGSSSGKPVPQFGHARLVENTAGASPAAALSMCTTPRPCSSAASSASRSGASRPGCTMSEATGSSMECSTNRSNRGHFAVGSNVPSTRNSAKALAASPLGERGVQALARDDERRQQGDFLAAVVFEESGRDGIGGLRLDRSLAASGSTERRVSRTAVAENDRSRSASRPCSCAPRGWCAARLPPSAVCRRSRRRPDAKRAERIAAHRR